VSPQAAQWNFAPRALELTLVSDPFLNEYGGTAHPLVVCVYQLAGPDSFKREAATVQGMARLLECSRFDDDVVSVKAVTVRPGQDETLTLDRNPKARFVAVAAGYDDAHSGAATRVFPIPVAQETSGWLWWKETKYRPAKLSRNILLGKTGIAGEDER